MKKIIGISLVLLVFAGLTVFALPSGTNASERGTPEKIVFIHYKDGHAKPPWAGGGGSGTDTTTCYVFLSKGTRWKTTQPYYINPTNSEGLNETQIFSAATASDNAWDSQVSFDIFGNAIVDYTAVYNNSGSDGKNTLSFGNVGSNGAIGITTIWGYFGGPPQTREIVEWDMLLDEADYDWGIGEAAKMDLQNIITHELGHAAGLGDLYENKCGEMTMYGYSTEGETKKHTLENGDIKGITELYK